MLESYYCLTVVFLTAEAQRCSHALVPDGLEHQEKERRDYREQQQSMINTVLRLGMLIFCAKFP
jgi:hypothetical protein